MNVNSIVCVERFQRFLFRLFFSQIDIYHFDDVVNVCLCACGCSAFWDVVLAFPLELQKRLLHFTTGSDRVPVGGMADLNFKISKIDVSTDW